VVFGDENAVISEKRQDSGQEIVRIRNMCQDICRGDDLCLAMDTDDTFRDFRGKEFLPGEETFVAAIKRCGYEPGNNIGSIADIIYGCPISPLRS